MKMVTKLALLLSLSLAASMRQSCILETGDCSYNVQLAPPGGCSGTEETQYRDILERLNALEKGHNTTQRAITQKAYDKLLEELGRINVMNIKNKKQIATLEDDLRKKDVELKNVTSAKNAQTTALEKQNRDLNRNLMNCLQGEKKLKQENNALVKAVKSLAPKTCRGWWDAGYRAKGEYIIDPDGPSIGVEPYVVECSMIAHTKKVATIVHSNSEQRTEVTQKCEPSLCTKHAITYNATMSQMVALINASPYCQQFLKHECHGSIGLASHGRHLAAWYSRDGTQMKYWGGAAPGSGKCQCGMTDTCTGKNQACNCEANDLIWREDSGYLTDKASLPVTQLAFGDLKDGGEMAYYLVGPLICYN